MASVILNWIYILITAYLAGYGALRGILRLSGDGAGQGGAGEDGAEQAEAAEAFCGSGRGALAAVLRWDACLVCGLVCATVYAQLFSLFAGVGLAANLLLCAVCAGIAWRWRRELLMKLRAQLAACPGEAPSSEAGGQSRAFLQRRLQLTGLFLLFLLFAYGTSRGMLHYDTGLYHAQSIRWIEEYGAVKGLVNLHSRLAYNSAAFALSALYSMAFLGFGSLHCVAGFLAFLLAAVCLGPLASFLSCLVPAGFLRKLFFKDGKSSDTMRNCDDFRALTRFVKTPLSGSTLARLLCVYYLVNVFDEMISPASDFFLALFTFYLAIRWLDLTERGEEELCPYALLCVLAAFLLTVKLSAAALLVFALYPAAHLFGGRRWREIALYLGLGAAVALPFLARNVILSGWLVYPFTGIDLFDVAWKAAKGAADYDAREIQVWGRGYTDVNQYNLPMGAWLPGWFQRLAGSERLFVLAAVAAVAALLLWTLWLAACWLRGLQGLRGRRRSGAEVAFSVARNGAVTFSKVRALGAAARAWAQGGNLPALLAAQAALAASFLFWLCTSPLIRYGCVYVYLTVAAVFGGILQALAGRWAARAAAGDGRRFFGGVAGGDRHGGQQSFGGAVDGAGTAGSAFLAAARAAWRRRVAAVFVALFLLYKGFALGRGIAASFENDHWLLQKDYESYALQAYEIDGFTFYYPPQGDQTGYDPFPAAPARANVRLLGETLAEGFAAERFP